MNNVDLVLDFERIKGIWEELKGRMAYSTAEDFDLKNPYAIDIEDSSYFYPTKEERDEDYKELVRTIKGWNRV